MNRIAMSVAASGLLRALIGRARVPRDRILLTNLRSVDWRSLTFTGERHQIDIRVPGPNSGEIVERLCARLEDAEFSIPGVLVADIAVTGEARCALDGSTSVAIEALTLSKD
jgi:anti-sigma factor RsiW